MRTYVLTAATAAIATTASPVHAQIPTLVRVGHQAAPRSAVVIEQGNPSGARTSAPKNAIVPATAIKVKMQVPTPVEQPAGESWYPSKVPGKPRLTRQQRRAKAREHRSQPIVVEVQGQDEVAQTEPLTIAPMTKVEKRRAERHERKALKAAIKDHQAGGRKFRRRDRQRSLDRSRRNARRMKLAAHTEIIEPREPVLPTYEQCVEEEISRRALRSRRALTLVAEPAATPELEVALA